MAAEHPLLACLSMQLFYKPSYWRLMVSIILLSDLKTWAMYCINKTVVVVQEQNPTLSLCDVIQP
jgi:hypothetical protein